jgi:5-hydroxyisourate hydrolase-like protein (transthyretin family)
MHRILSLVLAALLVAGLVQAQNTHPPRARVVGLVTDDSTAAPVPGILVRFFRASNPMVSVRTASTGMNGRYEAALDTGRYIIRAESGYPYPNVPQYLPEWFDNVPSPDLATVIVLRDTVPFTANFGLRRAPAPPGPPVPANLAAQPYLPLPDAARLTWDAPQGPWTFRVYRSADDSTHFQSIGGTAERSFVNYHLALNRTYYYRVTSVALVNGRTVESPHSNTASIRLTGTPGPKGIIAGTVLDDSTGLPIRGVGVKFFRRLSNLPPFYLPAAFTDSLGRYQAQLDTGTYIIKAEAACSNTSRRYVSEYYDNAPTAETATPVTVTPEGRFTANFGLRPVTPPVYVYVSGTVRDTAGNALRNASVTLMRPIQELNSLFATTGVTPGLGEEMMEIEGVGHTRGVAWRGFTDSLGRYRARVIAGRSYIAMAVKPGFLAEYYNNKRNPAEADVIPVQRDTAGIDFSLAARVIQVGSIAGSVRDSLGTRVPSRIALLPVRTIWPSPGRFGHTDSNGVFLLNDVPAGSYFVLALPFSGYAPAYYAEGEYGVSNWRNADTVVVGGAVTGVNVGVVPISNTGIARLAGRIRNTAGASVAGVGVLAANSQGDLLGYGLTDGTGRYAIDAVAAGTVTVSADRMDYTPAGAVVTVAPTTFAVENLDFTLNPVNPTAAGETGELPGAYLLGQNYPNPFNPSTTLSYTIPEAGVVSLKIYTVLGEEVATLAEGQVAAGQHLAVWNGRNRDGAVAASGVYLYRLTVTPASGAGGFTAVRKMVLMK